MSDAIVLRALQLREHRILELEDENRRLKAALYEADRESTQRIGEEVARAEAAEAKVARVEALRENYQKVPPPAMVPLAAVVGDLNKAIVGVDDE